MVFIIIESTNEIECTWRIHLVPESTTTLYDAAGRSIVSIDPLEHRTTTIYDAAGQVIETINPASETTTSLYDAASRQIASINPLGSRSTTVYDAASQTIATIDPLGNRTTTTYDDAGNLMAMQNANDHRTSYVYDFVNQEISTENALGNRTTTVYDAVGRQTELVDARSNRLTFQYDALGNKTVDIDQLLRRTTFAYDAASQQTLRIDAIGNRTSYTYDANGQNATRLYPDSSRITWTYDSLGKLINIDTELGNHVRKFDSLSRTIRYTNPDSRTITFSWDAASQRQFMIDPDGGKTTYTYTAGGQVKKLVDPQAGVTTFHYDAVGRETGKHLANGTVTTTIYDQANRLTSVANVTSTGTTLTAYLYSYDNVGNKTSQADPDGDWTLWGYDATNQLLTEADGLDLSWNTMQVNQWNSLTVDQWNTLPVSGTPTNTTTFSYDSVGNRLLKETATEITTSIYDVANQLNTSEESAGTTTYTYDNNGNQRSIETPAIDLTTYSWDYENRTSSIEFPDNSLVTYLYDPNNQRDEYVVQKQTDTETTKYFWDNRNILQEYDVTTEARYNYALQAYGNLISQYRDDAESSYYHYDGIKSTSAITNSSEVETDTYIYNAFGETTSSTGTTENPFTWKGEVGYYQDADGLQLLRNRRYSPEQGRFISEDPIGLDSGESNFYSYVANNPVNGIDPDGEAPYPCSPSWHHLLNQAIFDDAFLKKHGINNLDINSREYGQLLPWSEHSCLHNETSWDQDWKKWLQREEDAGRRITKDSIDAKLVDMRDIHSQSLNCGASTKDLDKSWNYKEWKKSTRAKRKAATRNILPGCTNSSCVCQDPGKKKPKKPKGKHGAKGKGPGRMARPKFPRGTGGVIGGILFACELFRTGDVGEAAWNFGEGMIDPTTGELGGGSDQIPRKSRPYPSSIEIELVPVGKSRNGIRKQNVNLVIKWADPAYDTQTISLGSTQVSQHGVGHVDIGGGYFVDYSTVKQLAEELKRDWPGCGTKFEFCDYGQWLVDHAN